MASRFQPSDFQHNLRVAAALVPSLAVLAGFGGQIPAAVLLVGAMLTYTMDALRYREGALAAIWLSLGLTNLSLLFTTASLALERGILLSFLTAVCNGATLFMTGIWATLQFKWVQLQYPVAAVVGERLLMSSSLPLAGMVHGWGAVGAAGESAAPFYLAGVLCGLYALCALPLPSSFYGVSGKGGKHSSDSAVLSPVEGAVAAGITAFLPLAVFCAVHLSVLGDAEHFWGALLLGFGPLAFICCLREGLWWVSKDPKARGVLQRTVLLASLGLALAGLEGRVLLRAFGQYLGLQPPWNVVLLSTALYGGVALVLLHFAGLLGSALATTWGALLLMVFSAAAAVAAGMPVLLLPAPMLAASGLALFQESGALRDYLLFASAAGVSGGWFVLHHHWHLDIHLGAWSLQHTCVVLIAGLALALALPGLAVCGGPRSLTGAVGATQAVVIAALEEHLYAGEHQHGAEDAYPAAFVVLTSLLGGAMTWKLSRPSDCLGPVARWVQLSVYASKLSMLLVPQAGMARPVLGVVLAASAPHCIWPAGKDGKARVPLWALLAHALSIFLTVVNARFALFDALAWLAGLAPGEGLLVGVLLLATAAACFPLLGAAPPGLWPARTALILLAGLGCALIVLQPPLPIQGGADCPPLPFGLCPRLWDEGHTPAHLQDDAAIYEDAAMAGRVHWAMWWLVAALVLGLLAFCAQGDLRGASMRSSVVCLALFLGLEYFPQQFLLQMAIFAATLCAGEIVGCVSSPGLAKAPHLPTLAVAWGLLLPCALVLTPLIPAPPVEQAALRILGDPDAASSDFAAGHRAAIMAIYAAQALMLALAARLVSAEGGPDVLPRRTASRTAYRDSSSFLGACLQPGFAQPQIGKAGDLSWLATCGNAAALLAFGLCLVLHPKVTEGADEAIFALATILLLLARDPVLLPGLSEARRYAPYAAAVGCYLGASAVGQMLSGASTRTVQQAWWARLGDAAALLLAAPQHYLFPQHLWSRTSMAGEAAISLGVAGACALVLTRMWTLRLLALSAVGEIIIQQVSQQHERQQGLKII